MKRLLHTYLSIVCVALLAVACATEEPTPTPPTPGPEPSQPTPLTENHALIIYMQGNNGLAEFMDKNLQNIISAYYDIDASRSRVVLFYDRGNYTRLTELYLSDGMAKQRLICEYDTSTSTVDKSFMQDVLQTIKSEVDADSYGLILSSHGGGWVPSALYDVYLLGEGSRAEEPKAEQLFYGQDDYDCMEIEDLVAAIEDIHFDYIIFDACFMGNVEALYDMRHSADYIIASPAEVPGAGFPYKEMIPMLFEYEGHQLEAICQRYMAQYEGGSATVALVDCSKLDALAVAMREVVASGDNGGLDIDSIQAFDNFPNHLFFDLENYAEQIATTAALDKFRTALREAVLFSDHTEKIDTSTGDSDTIIVTRSSGLTTYIEQEECPATYEAWLATAWAKYILGND